MSAIPPTSICEVKLVGPLKSATFHQVKWWRGHCFWISVEEMTSLSIEIIMVYIRLNTTNGWKQEGDMENYEVCWKCSILMDLEAMIDFLNFLFILQLFSLS